MRRCWVLKCRKTNDFANRMEMAFVVRREVESGGRRMQVNYILYCKMVSGVCSLAESDDSLSRMMFDIRKRSE